MVSCGALGRKTWKASAGLLGSPDPSELLLERAGEPGVVEDDEVLPVAALGLPGPVERARGHDAVVRDEEFVVHDRVAAPAAACAEGEVVPEGALEEGRLAPGPAGLGLVHDHPGVDVPPGGVGERLGDAAVGEVVDGGLEPDVGGPDEINDGAVGMIGVAEVNPGALAGGCQRGGQKEDCGDPNREDPEGSLGGAGLWSRRAARCGY